MTRGKWRGRIYIARATRTGSVTIAHTSPSAPSTAIPTIRNGSSNSHTSGYSTSAANASGQHSTSRMHHKRNLITRPLLSPKYA